MAMLDGAAQSGARSAAARRVSDVMQQVRDARALLPNPPVSPGLPSRPGTPTRTQPPAEAAPASATPTTGRGTRRRRDEDAPPTVERDTSGLKGLPAPRDSRDASGKTYDNAASWVDDRREKVKALLKKLQEQEQVAPKPLTYPSP